MVLSKPEPKTISSDLGCAFPFRQLSFFPKPPRINFCLLLFALLCWSHHLLYFPELINTMMSFWPLSQQLSKLVILHGAAIPMFKRLNPKMCVIRKTGLRRTRFWERMAYSTPLRIQSPGCWDEPELNQNLGRAGTQRYLGCYYMQEENHDNKIGEKQINIRTVKDHDRKKGRA